MRLLGSVGDRFLGQLLRSLLAGREAVRALFEKLGRRKGSCVFSVLFVALFCVFVCALLRLGL